ncbi:hypothetical protein [Canibacter zhoujuaniae]|uniref:hypothetical protein n=1 Tax=Canibacter zhoujuaniae TaxID=2708343 RepID=UPI001423F053|nr:hypothetical protein [Canibacter zhoujuaniae]
MKLKHKIISFAIMCGFALAASTEMRERFDLEYPIIFYGIHGLFIIGMLTYLLLGVRRQKIAASTALRGILALLALYAVGATRASFAPALIVIVGIATMTIWVLTERARTASKGSGYT